MILLRANAIPSPCCPPLLGSHRRRGHRAQFSHAVPCQTSCTSLRSFARDSFPGGPAHVAKFRCFVEFARPSTARQDSRALMRVPLRHDARRQWSFGITRPRTGAGESVHTHRSHGTSCCAAVRPDPGGSRRGHLRRLRHGARGCCAAARCRCLDRGPRPPRRGDANQGPRRTGHDRYRDPLDVDVQHRRAEARYHHEFR